MRARLGLIAIALSLTACGGGTTADTASDGADATETAAAATAAEFASPLDLGSGVSITISRPSSFKPGDFASNYFPDQTADLFTVDVMNAGKTALDLSTVLFTATADGVACIDVLDGDNGINGAPTEPVAAGGSVEFKYAIACDAKPGAALELGVAYGEVNAALAGKLA